MFINQLEKGVNSEAANLEKLGKNIGYLRLGDMLEEPNKAR